MKKIILVLLILIVGIIILISAYGIISWHIFSKSTFLSTGANCFPSISEPGKKPITVPTPLKTKFFGGRCASY